ncbi:alpha/beta hydrolase [Tolumonas lignilytica]|uniref:alpha/beta hydrolase n=1 Tax=Tolumonas lignilytica TaxID=1283284 RepID=UPI000463F252|nr:alpha/beta hydrolase [Tolumonas lignilytica]
MTVFPKKLTTIASALLLGTALTGASCMTYAENINPTEPVSMVAQWDKTFPQSNKVEHRKVTFKNRYGITLVGDLYLPRNRADKKLAAIAISGPFGAVKEQSSGLYAQTLAERGFITLAFDPSYTGESGGEPRNVASPDINTEDFSAAVDFLGIQKEIDRNRIGILGICGWGGMALNAVAADTRVKAVATSVMYDMSRVMAKGLFDSMTAEQRHAALDQISQQRWADAESGKPAPMPGGLPDKLPADANPIIKEFHDYYKVPRGFHPRSVNSNGAWTGTTAHSFMNFPLMSYANEITTPTLIVTGEKAHSRYFAEDAYKAIGGKNKELVIVPNANHVDLYDNQAGKIPFDKFEQFYKTNLQ